MNNRLNIQDLAGLLSAHAGKESGEIERFLKEFIAVVLEGVYTDKVIKVKGLGTFKIISVEQRESIHVNTGERFLIPAHYKFSFLPDKDLREQVNKPFSIFETTEINENVNFTDMDESEDEKDLDLEDESVEEVIPDREIPAPVLGSVHEIKSEPEPVAEPDLTPAPDVEIMPVVEPEPTPVVESDSSESKPETSQEPVRNVSPKYINKGIYLGGAAVILVMISSVVIYLGKERWLKAPEKPVAEQARDTLLPQDTLREDDSSYLIYPDSVDARTLRAEPPTYEVPKSKALEYVEIAHGDRLTMIAQKYYGNKLFWVYIYQHNQSRIKDPNNVPIGTVIEIPVPELYGIDVNSRESRDKAAALQTKILTGK